MTMIGKAHISGISGSLTTINSTSINDATYGMAIITDKRTAKNPGDFDPLTDQKGELVGGTYRGQRLEVEITFIPVGSSAADTEAACKSLVALLPATAFYITLAGFEDTTFNTTYVVMNGATVDYTSGGKASITMTATKYANIDSATLVTVKS